VNAFKVGEIAIFQNARFYPQYSGMECEITQRLHSFRAEQTGEVRQGYSVRFADGFEGVAQPHQLRKKHPPKSYTGELRIIELFNVQPVKVGEPA
jgi:hypothetical protein